MLQFTRYQVLAVAALMLGAVLFALPNFLKEETRNAMPGFLPKGTINLGLDLQGGSYLLLGVDTDKVINDRMQNILTDIRAAMRPNRSSGRERIRAENLSYNADSGVIILRLRNAADLEAAQERVARSDAQRRRRRLWLGRRAPLSDECGWQSN